MYPIDITQILISVAMLHGEDYLHIGEHIDDDHYEEDEDHDVQNATFTLHDDFIQQSL